MSPAANVDGWIVIGNGATAIYELAGVGSRERFIMPGACSPPLPYRDDSTLTLLLPQTNKYKINFSVSLRSNLTTLYLEFCQSTSYEIVDLSQAVNSVDPLVNSVDQIVVNSVDRGVVNSVDRGVVNSVDPPSQLSRPDSSQLSRPPLVNSVDTKNKDQKNKQLFVFDLPNYEQRWQTTLPPWRTGREPNDWNEEIIEGIRSWLDHRFPNEPKHSRADAIGYCCKRENPSHSEYPTLVARCNEIQKFQELLQRSQPTPPQTDNTEDEEAFIKNARRLREEAAKLRNKDTKNV